MVCGGQRREAEPHELEPFAALLQLADLDRARADVDPDQVLSFRHLATKCGTRDKTSQKSALHKRPSV